MTKSSAERLARILRRTDGIGAVRITTGMHAAPHYQVRFVSGGRQSIMDSWELRCWRIMAGLVGAGWQGVQE